MLELYNWLLAIHVLGAVIWVGGSIALQIQASRAERANDGLRMAALAADSEWIGQRIFMPASLLLLAAGIIMVVVGNWGFETLWVVIGIAGFVYSIISGAAFLGPRSGKLKKLMAERPADDPEVTARIKEILKFARIELVILIVVVLDMTLKPTL